MQNDLIVFEFSNGDGSEVLLDLDGLSSVAAGLVAFLSPFVMPPTWNADPAAELKVRLAAVERGSIRIGFKPIINEARIDRDLARAASVTALLLGAYQSLIWAGIASEAFQPVGPIDEQQRSVLVEEGRSVLSNPQARESLERVVRDARNAGAAIVTIVLPDQPACYLIDTTGWPSRLGALGSPIPELYLGLVEGELKIRAAGPPIEIGGVEGPTFVGELTVTNRTASASKANAKSTVTFLVLVQMDPTIAPHVGSGRLVRGILRPLAEQSVRTTHPISDLHHSVSGVLTLSPDQP